MSAARIEPESFEEQVVYWSIAGTWCIWLIGGLYILAPALGWSLAALSLGRRLGVLDDAETRYPERVPLGCVIWALGMAVMALALLIGHLEHDLMQFIKSFIGWMKGWALIALFAYVGATMTIRPAVIYRASNKLAAQTLVLAPIFYIAGQLQLPNMQYVSPLSALGGAGMEYFTVELYSIDLGVVRWRFFSPWSPAAALVATMSLVFAFFDRDLKWKAAGILATIVVCLMAQSRLSYIVVPILGLLILGLSNLTRPMVYALGAAACVVVLPFISSIAEVYEDTQERFKNARASSSRVRAALQSIALHRWWNEAPVWGHGTVERGPHLVANMPIGTHHTWNGLLFVKGGVGFVALAIPMAWSMLETVAKAQSDRVARAALGVMLVLLFFSFAENLETLIYLYWPGVVVIGIAMKRRFVRPSHAFMGR